MKMTSRLDPELVAPLESFLSLTGGGLNLHDIADRDNVLKQALHR